MAFEKPIDKWKRGKEILLWAILWIAYIDLLLLGFCMIRNEAAGLHKSGRFSREAPASEHARRERAGFHTASDARVSDGCPPGESGGELF